MHVRPATRFKRGLGLSFLESGIKLAQMVPDRVGYLRNRLIDRGSHSQLIDAFMQHVCRGAPSPTPTGPGRRPRSSTTWSDYAA